MRKKGQILRATRENLGRVRGCMCERLTLGIRDYKLCLFRAALFLKGSCFGLLGAIDGSRRPRGQYRTIAHSRQT